MANKKELSAVLNELKSDYLSKLPTKISKLIKLANEENWNELYTEYHKLKGTGKTYGFPEISTVCERLEALAQKKETQKKSLFKEAAQLIEEIRASYVSGKNLDLTKHPFGKTLLRSGKIDGSKTK